MAVALSRKLPLMPAEATQPARPAELRFHLALLIAAVALGSLLQLYGPAWSQDVFSRVKLDSLAGVCTLLLALLASVAVHELGHLSAALVLKYEIFGAAIGPIQFDWWHGKGTTRLRSGHWFRCSISAVPREMPNAWRSRMMTVVAAGPAISLLFLLVAMSVALAEQSAGASPSFWSCCAEVNFFLVILGLVPNSRFAAVRNDAALFLALWKNEADAEDIFMCHQAVELSLRGIRPEDYPQELLSDLAGFAGRPYTRLIVARRMVEWAIDSGNIQLAGEWDQAALTISELCGPYWANLTLAESACFDVIFRDDPKTVARKFADVELNALFPPSLEERAYAASLLASGAAQQASRHILRAQYHLPVGDAYYHYERALLDLLHCKILSIGAHDPHSEMLMF